MNFLRRIAGTVAGTRFMADERGAIAIIFGFIVVSLLGISALAIDYSRGISVQSDIQAAADAAALAARADATLSTSAIIDKAKKFYEANAKQAGMAEITGVDVKPDDTSVEVTVRAKMDTPLGSLIGTSNVDITATSKAVAATEDLELALVLDNTGSMSGNMDDLRTGAKDLVKTLFDNAGNKSKMKMSVVPYVGSVNIGSNAKMAWMDVNADSKYHGEELEWLYFGYELGCVYAPGGGPVDPGTGVQGSIWDGVPKFADLARKVLGVADAQAATAGDVPAPFNFSPDCWIASPSKLNHFTLLSQIPNAQWKGCVESRPEPYDVTDVEPDMSTPDSLFVPWFWPDEIDNTALAAEGVAWMSSNDYLPDRLDLRNAMAPKFDDPWIGWGQTNVLKYNGSNATIDEVAPDTSGPNRSCPDPILPLTKDQSTIESKIDGLMHWNGSGTNIPEGLAWGWRTLSPAEPFAEGEAYGKANKVIVLMTDGVNNVDPKPEFTHLSEYSAYGYLQQWGQNRIADKSFTGFKSYADSRLAQVCANAKAENIQIYTVAFGVTDPATLQLLEDCATAPPYAYTASTSSDLVAAFKQVASDLTRLRLSN